MLLVNALVGFASRVRVSFIRWGGATPTMPLGGTAANINDNNTGTTATTGAVGDKSAAAVSARIFAKLDFGSNREVERAELKTTSLSSGSDSAAGFYYSNDDTNWTAFGSAFTINATPGDKVQTPSTAVNARYWAAATGAINYTTITITVADFNVYGPI